VSEGSGETTKVVDAETGEELENVIGLELSMDAFNVQAALLVRDPHLAINNLEAQEIRQGDSAGYDGGTSSSDNQQHIEQASQQV
tara:strand:+ start:832 stop:1086 length:255 start_codon:yes stop_codon:yes gene_type:complete